MSGITDLFKRKSKVVLPLFALFCAVYTLAQEEETSYEAQFDKVLQEGHPVYFKGVSQILFDFEQHLIDRKIIPNGKHGHYIDLLEIIAKNDSIRFPITYHLGDSIQKLENELQIKGESPEVFSSLYMRTRNKEPKKARYAAILQEKLEGTKRLERAEIAAAMLLVYRPEDLNFLVCKRDVYEFLDPNTEGVLYLYMGKPTKE